MITFKLEGWKELAADLKRLPQRVERNAITAAFRRAAKLVLAAAQTTTTFQDQSGDLRNSMKVENAKRTSTSVGVNVVARAPHAHLQEFGWKQKTASGSRQIPAKSFMRDAMEQNRDQILKIFAEELKKECVKRMGKLGIR